jgi:hypothetical protein
LPQDAYLVAVARLQDLSPEFKRGHARIE